MNEDYGIDLENAKITISVIAEILGYPALQTEIKESSIIKPMSLKPANIGELYNFGGYEWRVLNKQNGRILLLLDRIWDKRPYNETGENTTWERCTLRKELNNKFYNSIPKSDRERVIKTRISNPNNPCYGTPGGNDTEDYVFILSLDEVVNYFGDSHKLKKRLGYVHYKYAYYIDDQYNNARIAYDEDDKVCVWSLRSPGFNGFHMIEVYNDGNIRIDGYFNYYNSGVRPACWVNI